MATATVTVLDAQREYRRGQIYVALAALVWSTAGVLQRGLQVDTATQVALRAAFACVTILAYVAVAERGRVVEACLSVGIAGIGFAVAVACASGSFIVALNHTTVAHVLFIQAMAPVLAALLAWLLLGEPVSTGAIAWMNSTCATVVWLSATMKEPDAHATATANPIPATPTERHAATTRPRSVTAT